jgi:hypothetical protein
MHVNPTRDDIPADCINRSIRSDAECLDRRRFEKARNMLAIDENVRCPRSARGDDNAVSYQCSRHALIVVVA